MAILQNFSVPAGDSLAIKFEIDDDEAVDLHGAISITWKVFEQEHGVVADGAAPIIEKSIGAGIEVNESPQYFTADLESEDTIDLLGNFFHEASIEDSTGEIITLTQGIMTVTEAH